ncbi:hypothetical protein PGB90_000636 [Kerria lacca]
MLDGGTSNRPKRKTALILRKLDRLNINIAALSETRLSEKDSIQEKNYTFFWKGREPGLPREYGVGFAVKNKILGKHSEAPAGINQRIMIHRLQIQNSKPINLVNAYAPRMQATDEMKKQFYEKLNEIASQIPTSESLIIPGDYNVRLGEYHEAWNDVIKKQGQEKMNLNGELLLCFCFQNSWP